MSSYSTAGCIRRSAHPLFTITPTADVQTRSFYMPWDQKRKLFSTFLSLADRFSKFFYRYPQQYICYKVITKDYTRSNRVSKDPQAGRIRTDSERYTECAQQTTHTFSTVCPLPPLYRPTSRLWNASSDSRGFSRDLRPCPHEIILYPGPFRLPK